MTPSAWVIATSPHKCACLSSPWARPSRQWSRSTSSGSVAVNARISAPDADAEEPELFRRDDDGGLSPVIHIANWSCDIFPDCWHRACTLSSPPASPTVANSTTARHGSAYHLPSRHRR
ncbi:hypothetical protein CSAL01_11131 [Colletotrichum salicis]|uniref:Uncharacterized protein n=1 Tax=Colletotrichum salicis TaxID=1209931 RepID=A0A135S393_9PEZI|nr:hypothetical protein CSAL01_11131 [Colletotrichum salicis]